ncbi:MAG: hypothetical protein ACYS32_10650, partial [Planctomycetota bacterium]
MSGSTGRIDEDSYIGRTHHIERVNVGLTFLKKEGWVMRTKQLICFASFVLVPAFLGTTRAEPVPPPWISADIGFPMPGSADWDPFTGVLTITANGHDIWDNSDDFHYVYREWSGDCDLIVQVLSFPLGP